MYFCHFSTTFAVAITTLLSYNVVFAQTSTKCNPLNQTCAPDPALGRSVNIDFTSGASSEFTPSGNGVAYNSNGLALTVAQHGDSPTITSKWYIMFGHVEVQMKAAPGQGIVSSAVLQSDDLDEIDWEWLGGDSSQVQSNYFGKGETGSYNRGAFHADPNHQASFVTYAVDWTAEQVVWSINGQTVRVLAPSDAGGQYPQTPMQVKLGAWAGGDPSNAAGTVSWAGGPVNYAGGPYTMVVKSLAVTDYSTGTQYTYGDRSGSWQSIQAAGGSVKSTGSSSTDTAAPAITSTTSGGPMPFEGTHADPSSTYATPSVWPWVSGPSTLTSSVSAVTSIPGLPAGWTVSGSGKVVPPSSAPSTYPVASSTVSPQASSSAAPFLAGESSLSAMITNAPSPTPASGSHSAVGFIQGLVPGAQTTASGSPNSTVAAAPSVYTGSAVRRAHPAAIAVVAGAAGLLAAIV